MFIMVILFTLVVCCCLSYLSGHNSHDNRKNMVIEFCHCVKPKILFNSILHFRGEEITGQRCEGTVIYDAFATLKEFGIRSLFFP